MDVKKAVKERRSIRKFKRDKVSREKLKDLINAARLAPSAMNKQPLEFIAVDRPELEKKIFNSSGWAGSVSWSPDIEERPPAYIVILADLDIDRSYFEYDAGLAAENICLSALREGLGSCLIASFDKSEIRDILKVPGGKEICLAVGLGYPDQESVFHNDEGSLDYWMDEKRTFHVPKKN